jgi:hypothetical protein
VFPANDPIKKRLKLPLRRFSEPLSVFSVRRRIETGRGLGLYVMKKLIFVIFMIFCISCDENLVPTESRLTETPTTYQISNNLKLYPPEEFIDGSLWEVIIYYFIENEIVKVDSIEPVLTGEMSPKIKIASSYQKLKFSFQFAPRKSLYYLGCANCRRYSGNFTFIEKGKNIIIEIHDLSSITLSL